MVRVVEALRDFVLQLARLDPSTKSVIAICRCGNVSQSEEDSEAKHFKEHAKGVLCKDGAPCFHATVEAERVPLLPDVQSGQIDSGDVLIRYMIRDIS